ncbi:hypothetical protein SNEBB_007197 [Seison nebaliae]|nr:hypothetical protein SNEBB_007197 [Seison nebaliae]
MEKFGDRTFIFISHTRKNELKKGKTKLYEILNKYKKFVPDELKRNLLCHRIYDIIRRSQMFVIVLNDKHREIKEQYHNLFTKIGITE